MTKAQIDHIVEDVFNDKVDTVTPLLSCFSIVISKEQIYYTNIDQWRYKFDDTNQIFEAIPIHIYAKGVSTLDNLPSSGNYDYVSSTDSSGNTVYTIYEYQTDKDGNLYCDDYSYDAILGIVPGRGVKSI